MDISTDKAVEKTADFIRDRLRKDVESFLRDQLPIDVPYTLLGVAKAIAVARNKERAAQDPGVNQLRVAIHMAFCAGVAHGTDP